MGELSREIKGCQTIVIDNTVEIVAPVHSLWFFDFFSFRKNIETTELLYPSA